VGHLAKIVLKHAVELIIKAWDDASMNVHQITEEILECLFHPDFHNSRSKIQRDMLAYMHTWVQSLGHNQHSIIQRLTKQAVRNHENIHRAGDGGMVVAEESSAHNQGNPMQQIQGYASSTQQFIGIFSGGPLGQKEKPSHPVALGASHTPGYGGPGSPFPTPPSSGETVSFYSHDPPVSYAPPHGPPPPNVSGAYASHASGSHHPHSGTYAPNYSSPPPFPHHNPTGGYAGSYSPPSSGGPAFQGHTPYDMPPSPATGFSPPYGPPPGRGGYPPHDSYNQQYGGER